VPKGLPKNPQPKDAPLTGRAVRMSDAQWQKVSRLASARGQEITPSHIVRELIDDAYEPAEICKPKRARTPKC
jgi:hypothetical protein